MEKIYCIYTDKFITEDSANPEHIIPLALGGSNEFTILVETNKNSELGSAIDGKLANDFLMSLIRRNNDYKGHSKKSVIPTLKKSKVSKPNTEEKAAQIIFSKEEIKVFNPIENKYLDSDEIRLLTIKSTFSFDRFLRLCFIAKVLLSSGYYIYEETFKNFADHNSLRKLMNLNITETKQSLRNLPLRVVDKFNPYPEEDKSMIETIEYIMKLIGGSCIIFILSTGNIIGSVGIGGEYLGSINFKADTTKFPDEDLHRLGHVIVIQNGKLVRDSFYEVVAKVKDFIDQN